MAGSYFDTLTASQNPSTSTLYVSGGAAVFPGNGAYGGQQIGDIVGNIRLDQAWGGAQIMGALHEVNATTTAPAWRCPERRLYRLGGGTCPSDAWGWAAGAGLRLNFPMIGQGDYFQAQVNATEGALRYIFFTPNSNWGKVDNGNLAYGVLSDCVYGGTLGTRNHDELSVDLGMGLQRRIRASLEPGVADFSSTAAGTRCTTTAQPTRCCARGPVSVPVPVRVPRRRWL